MTDQLFKWHLVVKRHPDGEFEFEHYGDSTITIPLLQLFFALHGIHCRLQNYRLFAPANQPLLDWGQLTPHLEEFVQQIAATQHQRAEFSLLHAGETHTYSRSMHFIFAEVGEWVELITPANQEVDLYGSDHGMYEHQIVLEPDLWQKFLLERILGKWGIAYEPIYTSNQAGLRLHQRHNTLSAYDGATGFFKRLEIEIRNLFTEFAKSQPTDFKIPELKFETVKK